LYRPTRCLPCPSPQRSKGALMQTSFACGQGFAPTPHAPIPTGDHPAGRRPRRSRGRSGDRHRRIGRRAAASPSRWARDPRRRRGTGSAMPKAPAVPQRICGIGGFQRGRSGFAMAIQPCTEYLYSSICPSPPAPPLPDRTGPSYRTRSRHSAPLGRLRPRGRGKPLPCLGAAL